MRHERRLPALFSEALDRLHASRIIMDNGALRRLGRASSVLVVAIRSIDRSRAPHGIVWYMAGAFREKL